MFQDFSNSNDPTLGSIRVAELRNLLLAAKLDGFLIPRADAHQSEIVAKCDERLTWLTGFTGSAGIAIVLAKNAAIFVDGRYTLQVKDQVDSDVFEQLHLVEQDPTSWLSKHVKKKQRIGYDPMLHTLAEVEKYSKICREKSAKFVPVWENLVDKIWKDQPSPPLEKVMIHPVKFSGESTKKKIRRIQKDIEKKSADVAVLTLPDSIAWLFNIRGNDISHTPVALSFALIPTKGRCTLFIDKRKITKNVRQKLAEFVKIVEPKLLLPTIKKCAMRNQRILLDPNSAPHALTILIKEVNGKIKKSSDPVVFPKAIKNQKEIHGARTAHVRDGIAFAKFLRWFDENSESGNLTEISCAKKLETFRRGQDTFRDISFDTISGYGANGAIIHYRVTKDTNKNIVPGSVYLVDSGAQFENGTTDITRTIAVGSVSDEIKERFTLVLKGHIAISSAVFPVDTNGMELDPLARIALWRFGLNYDHGTGHGVGSYLSVHEGPQSISKRGNVSLKPGMIISNEPGYYKTGEYGIRIENLELVRKENAVEGGEKPMLGFETLTLAPIDKRLIVPQLLEKSEIQWLDSYHLRILETIGPKLDIKTRGWLKLACSPLISDR